jgi:hypothetical protein
MSGNAAGVHVRYGTVGSRILDNKIVDNNRMSVLTEGGDDDSGAFGILLQGDGTEIAGNTISGSDAFSYDYGRDGAAIEIYGGRDNRIRYNLAVDNHTFTELGNPRSANNLYAYNVVRSSLANSTGLVTRGGDSSWGPIAGTVLHNNTLHFTGTGSQGFVCHGGCAPSILSMRNNIVQAVWKTGYADAAFDENHNLYWGGRAQFLLGPQSIVADANLYISAGGLVSPAVNSPAIDRGVPLGYGRDVTGTPVPIDGNGDGIAAPDGGAVELAP